MKAMTSIGADHRLEQRILSMKPEHETRRKIIREWMSLPKDRMTAFRHRQRRQAYRRASSNLSLKSSYPEAFTGT
jgi:hypothetical protein